MDTAVFLGTAENFVYGLCSAYFIYESATYFRHRREQRFYRTAAAIMAFWFLLVLKDPIYSCIDTQLHRHLYRTLLLVDMSAVFTCVFFVVAHRAEFGILPADARALHRDGKRHLL